MGRRAGLLGVSEEESGCADGEGGGVAGARGRSVAGDVVVGAGVRLRGALVVVVVGSVVGSVMGSVVRATVVLSSSSSSSSSPPIGPSTTSCSCVVLSGGPELVVGGACLTVVVTEVVVAMGMVLVSSGVGCTGRAAGGAEGAGDRAWVVETSTGSSVLNSTSLLTSTSGSGSVRVQNKTCQ